MGLYLNYTENELHEKFIRMPTKDIIDYLMEEGLTLKSDPKLDFRDVPEGIYRRTWGTDLILHVGAGQFNRVDTYANNSPRTTIQWDLGEGWNQWVLVLDWEYKPVQNGCEFKVNEAGERLA